MIFLIQQPTLPFSEPEIIFAVVLLIMFFTPLFLERLRIPSIAGLILAGVLIGPYGFYILERGEAIDLFGTIGLIYLMFLVGLEVDIIDLKKNKNRSLILGALSFFFPLILSGLAAYYMFSYSLTTSVLIAAAMASHTLISFPVIARLGITKSRASVISFGATVIVDTAVLLVLAFISGAAEEGSNIYTRLLLVAYIVVFTVLVLKGIPLLARLFFKRMNHTGSLQYIFILTVVFITSVLAEFMKIEPILGAFLAGIALNPYIPHVSPLMNRIKFIGNTLFIPFFLIGVGMMVDLTQLVSNYDLVLFVTVFFILAIAGKYLASFITQKVFRFAACEGLLMFGLTGARAAATIAVVMVGYNLELVGDNVLNGTVIIILLTSILSSMLTQTAGKRIVKYEERNGAFEEDIHDRILVPIANPSTLRCLIHLSVLLRHPLAKDPIFPLSVIENGSDNRKNVRREHSVLAKAEKIGSAAEVNIQAVTRVDNNIAKGIIRAADDLAANKVVIGWDKNQLEAESFSETILGALLRMTDRMLAVSHLLHSCNTFKRIFLVVPNNAHKESGFSEWVQTVRNFAKSISASLELFAEPETADRTEAEFYKGNKNLKIKTHYFDDWNDFLMIAGKMRQNDLIIFVKARRDTLSFHKAMDDIPAKLHKYHEEISFMFIYPHQDIILNDPTERIFNPKKDSLLKRMLSRMQRHDDDENAK